MKKKLRIQEDEFSPVYVLMEPKDEKWFPNEIFELDSSFIFEYDMAMAKFREIQKKLHKLIINKKGDGKIARGGRAVG